jgi:two-component sensor histidine kinase
MIRPWLTWIAFSLCLAVVLGAMGWISFTVIRLDDAQEKSHRDADLEESIRLALWRMDSALTPFIAQESMRPYFIYSSFYPTEQIFACTVEGMTRNTDLVPSPLLTQIPPHVLLHFQFDPDGKVSSPQVPTGHDRDLAKDGCTTGERIDASAGRLAELQASVTWEALLTALGHERPRAAGISNGEKRPPIQQQRESAEAQSLRNANEYSAREGNRLAAMQQYGGNNILELAYDAKDAQMKPLWINNSLLLARRVAYRGQEYVQGCWIDWPGLRDWLTKSVDDLLPGATLEPARADSGEKGARMLAGLPAMLLPGAVPAEETSISSPIRISLLVAWLCIVLAAVAVAALLLGVMSLSERRAAFVSAVTHELRTPLTTFRMYSELLSRGMIVNEEKRKRYLSTLCTEADRLAHLVENVLAFARIERRGWDAARMGSVGLVETLERLKTRLQDRADQAGMRISVESLDGVADASIRADPAAVEQILFNLVDNACKYATPSEDPTIHVAAERDGLDVVIRVRDHGPGISRKSLSRLFRPFSKSAGDAASSAPGVGLGLALSRRLARSMGGDLRLDPTIRNGASFALSLKLGSAPLFES